MKTLIIRENIMLTNYIMLKTKDNFYRFLQEVGRFNKKLSESLTLATFFRLTESGYPEQEYRNAINTCKITNERLSHFGNLTVGRKEDGSAKDKIETTRSYFKWLENQIYYACIQYSNFWLDIKTLINDRGQQQNKQLATLGKDIKISIENTINNFRSAYSSWLQLNNSYKNYAGDTVQYKDTYGLLHKNQSSVAPEDWTFDNFYKIVQGLSDKQIKDVQNEAINNNFWIAKAA